MLVVVYALDLPGIARYGDRQFSGRIHQAEKDFSYCLSAHLTGLPSIQDCIYGRILRRPDNPESTAAHENEHGGLAGGRHRFQQFLLAAGQVNIVPVAVLPAGAAEGGITL